MMTISELLEEVKAVSVQLTGSEAEPLEVARAPERIYSGFEDIGLVRLHCQLVG